MREYLFDVKLFAVFEIEAETSEEAEKILRGKLSYASVTAPRLEPIAETVESIDLID